MTDFNKRVNSFITKHKLIRSEDKLLVAVSGGPDSLALLHFLLNDRKIKRENILVCHLNHGLRKESSDEAAFVSRFTKQNKLNYEERTVSVAEVARQTHRGIEETARSLRYQFFADLMTKHQIGKLALAHHADDQVETILMRLVRGSSSVGWTGMRPVRAMKTGSVIRPFLAVTKQQILSYCKVNDLPFIDDESNTSDEYTRNRFRKYVLPVLQKENKALYEHFNRFSEESHADFLFLEELAEDIFKNKAQLTKQHVKISIETIKNIGIPLQRRVIHLLLKYLYRDADGEISAQQIQNILQLIYSNNPSGELHFSKQLTIRRSYDLLEGFFGRKGLPRADFYHQMGINDRLILASGAELKLKVKSSVIQTAGFDGIIVNAADITLPLIVRNRTTGDKMILKGTGGTKKIKDIFIDAKIPKYLRDNIPIITDFTGQILWIPEVKKSIYDVKSSRDHEQYVIRYNRNLGGNKSMHNDIQQVLISEEELQEKIKELGAELTTEYQNRNPLVIGVLKGATPFMMDLVKRIDTYLEMDFMDVSSYGNGVVSSGEVKIIKDLNTSVEGRDVLIIEDIIDSGRTLSYLVDLIKYRKAKSVKLVTLLDKPEGRNVDIEADYIGFVVPNEFVVGYGLDYAESYRNLPYIGILKPEIYSE